MSLAARNPLLVIATFAMISAGVAATEPPMRVLFIGDSLLGISKSYSNDIPAILTNLASNLGVPLACTKIASNSWTLADHATNAPSTNAIASGNYDFVVLQEKSQTPSLPSDRNTIMFPACRTLNGMITNHSERTMFYETWGFIDGDTPSHCNSYDIPAQYENCDGGFGSFLSQNIATREA